MDRGRVYGGQSEDERRAERRERLMTAGMVLFGRDGWDGTSIERLCTEAGVSTRYFYEEFRGREDLLEAVYRATAAAAVEHVRQALAVPGTPAERVASGLGAYVRHVTADPGRVRLLHEDARRQPSLAPVVGALRATYWQAMTSVGSDDGAPAPVPPLEGAALIRARAASGAVNEVLSHWLHTPDPRPAIEPLVQRVVRTLVPPILAASEVA